MEKVKEVLSVEDFQGMLGLKGRFGHWLSGVVIRFLEIDKVNRDQAKYASSMGPDFARNILREEGVRYEIVSGSLDEIPAEGGFITVSNHHYGSLDGLILCDTVGRRREDYKILTTFLLSLLPNLTESFLPVNNLGKKNDARSVNSIRTALRHIKDGGALGLFPAGICATWQKKALRVKNPSNPFEVADFPWAPNMMKLIRNSGLPVLPICFEGGNSLSFHLLGLIHRRLRTVRLVHELFNKQGAVVKVHIGPVIPAEKIQAFGSPEDLGNYLRLYTYSLPERNGG